MGRKYQTHEFLPIILLNLSPYKGTNPGEMQFVPVKNDSRHYPDPDNGG